MTSRSLHVGINANDPAHYLGLKPLFSAERDARAMAQLATSRGCTQVTTLLGNQATFAAVRQHLATAATTLGDGDTFLFTYAGHGGSVPDTNGDEPTGEDQTMCLYDRQLVDDLLYTDLALFRAGVRIIVVSDSCHSGTVVRAALLEVMRASPVLTALLGDGQSRAMPADLAVGVYIANQAMYDQQQTDADPAARTTMKASVLLLAACQDLQDAKGGAVHGNFTSALLSVWNGGKYVDVAKPSYRDFIARIGQRLGDPTQIPNLFQTGATPPDLALTIPFAL